MEKSYHQKNKYHKVHRDGKILYTLKNMKETYQYPILAIDGGGTKTMAAIAEKTGTIKKSIIVGPSNYHVVGRRDVETTLTSLFNQLCDEIGAEHCVINVGVFALAGIDTARDQEVIEKIIDNALEKSPIQFNKIIIENDALSVMIGTTQSTPGLILIAGTGSIAFAHNGKGKHARVGGWGHEVGDEGGGFWIGKEAIRATLRAYDRRGMKTELTHELLKHLSLENTEELYNWTYHPSRSIDQIAALSRYVEEAAKNGDEVAKEIIERAIDELYQLLVTAATRVNIHKDEFKLILLGGILQENIYIKEHLLKRIKQNIPAAKLITEHKKPIDIIVQRGVGQLQHTIK